MSVARVKCVAEDAAAVAVGRGVRDGRGGRGGSGGGATRGRGRLQRRGGDAALRQPHGETLPSLHIQH